MEPPSRKFLYSSVFTANLATATCGLAMGWSSPILPKLKGTSGYTMDDNPLGSFITDEDESWIGSLVPAGAVFSPIIAGYAADRLGRKLTLHLTVIPFLIGYLVAIFATHVYYFYIKQFLCGLTLGALYTVLAIYVTEISDDKVRGSLGSVVQVCTMTGFLISFILGPFLNVTVFNCVSMILPITFIVLFTFMAESPYYQVSVDKLDEAEKTLSRLRSLPVEEVRKELAKIKLEVDETRANKASFMDIFRSKGMRKAFILSETLAIFQQLSGISAVLAYTQDIFAATGTSMSPVLSSIIVGFVQFLAGFITPLLVDKLGRKLFLKASGFGTGITQIALGYYFYNLDNGYDVESIAIIPLISLILYIISYNVGYGPLPITIMSELFPSNVKSYASMAHVGTAFFWSFITARYFNNLVNLIGKCGTFWLFSIFCIASIFFVHVFVPETKGKSIQGIQDILNGKHKVNITEKEIDKAESVCNCSMN